MSSKLSQSFVSPDDDDAHNNAQERWRQALENYEKETGLKLLEHPFARDVLSQDNTDEVLELLQKFMDYRARGHKILGVLKPIVSVVLRFLDTGAEGASKVAPGGKAILVAFGALLQAMKGVSQLYDGVETLFHEVQSFVERIGIHLAPQTMSNPAVTRILLDTLVEILNVLAILTKHCKKAISGDSWWRQAGKVFASRTKDYFLVIMDKTDVPKALERLEELSKAEMQMTTADTNATSREVKQRVLAVHNSTVINDLRAWLDAPNPQPFNYERKRLAGSCRWFFDNQFERWKASMGGIYWVYGNAGSGKSVLCSSVIETLRKDDSRPLSYFYFDFSDPRKNDCRGLVSSLVFQIGTKFKDCLAHLEAKCSSCTPDDRPTFDELLEILAQLLRVSGPSRIVIDALDECPERKRKTGLFRFLDHLSGLDVDCQVFATSRPENDIRIRMSRLATQSLSFHDHSQHKDDLIGYISTHLTDEDQYPWSENSILREQVKSTLIDSANGMFLWVDLQLWDLQHCFNDLDVKRVLIDLPTDLHATYQRILNTFPSRLVVASRARQIFQCIATAKRPLFTHEVAHILSADTESYAASTRAAASGHSGWMDTDKTVVDNDRAEHVIRQSCPALLEFSDSSAGRTVQFIHFSVQEYLMSAELQVASPPASWYCFDESSAHVTLAKICLLALDIDGSLHKLRGYADEYWYEHVSQENEDALGNFLYPFLHIGSGSFSRWVVIDVREYAFGTALHFAVRRNLLRHVGKMLSQSAAAPCSIDVRDKLGRSALYEAVGAGHVEMCQLLLRSGASISVSDRDGETPVYYAASKGRLEILRILLEFPWNNDPDVVIACCRTRDRYGRTALHVAASASKDCADMCRLLIDHGALVDAMDHFSRTPLYNAVLQGNLGSMRTLLESLRQCNADSRDQYGRPMLHHAAENGLTDTCHLFLEHGALVDEMDYQNNTPLHCAAKSGHTNVCRLLLVHGASVNVVDHRGGTPLHYAVGGECIDMCRLLLERRASVNVMDYEKCTPLHIVAGGECTDICRLLLEHEASVNVMDCEACTPLHVVAGGGCTDMCRLLLVHGAHVQVINRRGGTPLHYAAARGHTDISSILIDSGALVNEIDLNMKTPLHCAADGGHKDICHLLLKQGVICDKVDFLGKTPLQYANCHGHTDVTLIFLEHTVMSRPSLRKFVDELRPVWPTEKGERLFSPRDLLEDKDCAKVIGRYPSEWYEIDRSLRDPYGFAF